MPEKAQLHRADPSPGQQPTVQKARLSDVSEMFRLVNYYAERQQMLPKTQLQLYENLRDYSIAVGTSNAACFSQACWSRERRRLAGRLLPIALSGKNMCYWPRYSLLDP